MMSYFLWYMLLINVLAFVFWGWDKWQAVGHKWRVSEKKLFILTALGGFLGALAGMQLFRHKTIKGPFLVWFWGIVVVRLIVVVWLLAVSN